MGKGVPKARMQAQLQLQLGNSSSSSRKGCKLLKMLLPPAESTGRSDPLHANFHLFLIPSCPSLLLHASCEASRLQHHFPWQA